MRITILRFFVAAFCKGKDLKEISPPAFLTTTTNEDDIIMDGQSVNYTCVDPSLLIPEELDEDSNFVLEILCLNGKFEPPEATGRHVRVLRISSDYPMYVFRLPDIIY